MRLNQQRPVQPTALVFRSIFAALTMFFLAAAPAAATVVTTTGNNECLVGSSDFNACIGGGC